jgi:DNA-binding transcriptional regulator YiaG
MSEAVEVLAPTNPDKLKRAIGSGGKASFVTKPSKTKRERIVVGWLSDLDSVKHRKELVDIVDLVVVGGSEGVPLVLIESKTVKAPSYSALETLTQWAANFGAYLAPDEHAVRRLVNARLVGAEQRYIASALIEGDKLVVWSCEPKRYEVRASEIPALARMNASDLPDFELSESGSALHWDAGDVDLNLDGILYYVDPKVRREQDKASREEAARYAGAIRALREDRGLTQDDIAGLTERQVRRVEQGESAPRTETLRKLAAAHGLSLDGYLKELAKRSKGRR